jgi:signal transduction histidine kinase
MDSGSPVNILIADDSIEDRAEAKAALLKGSPRKFKFYEVDLGSEAIEACAVLPNPRCLLLDYQLPDMDALEVIERLRLSNDEASSLPIVIVTGSDQMEAQRATWRDGAMGFIGKDWLTPASLTHVVEFAIQRHKLIKEQTRLVAALNEAAQARDQLIISERAARAEAEAANHLKDDFLETLAHELRNPLSTIMSWAQVLLLVNEELNPELRNGLKIIIDNGAVQAKLIDDLFDINRIARGKIALETQAIDSVAFVRQCVTSQRPIAETKGLTLIFQSEIIHNASVTADPTRMHQMIGNLLTNAIKFTSAGGVITVGVRQSDGYLKISVSDTGKGIAPDLLPYVFDRFRQGVGEKFHREGGLGLGLAIVKQLTILHGGEVHVASDGLGKGAAFTLKLPAAETLR